MKIFIVYLAGLIALSAVTPARAVDAQREPAVTFEPFEPPFEACYKWDDKFSHPKEIIAPRFLWPFEMRRATISGEVVILVELDGYGQAKRLATLYSTHPLFTKSAIQALKNARWDSTSYVWFYYKVVYDVMKGAPNQSPEPTPGAVH